jgi:hypothetical protein
MGRLVVGGKKVGGKSLLQVYYHQPFQDRQPPTFFTVFSPYFPLLFGYSKSPAIFVL